jgi:hypothetical protein
MYRSPSDESILMVRYADRPIADVRNDFVRGDVAELPVGWLLEIIRGDERGRARATVLTREGLIKDLSIENVQVVPSQVLPGRLKA